MLSQEAIEWPDEVESLMDQLESEQPERALSREEIALIDVYEIVSVLETDDCLHDFWQSGVDHQRIINSFELIGASTIVDAFNASRWCRTRCEDRNDYTETEADHLASIEQDLADGLSELAELVVEFIEDEMG